MAHFSFALKLTVTVTCFKLGAVWLSHYIVFIYVRVGVRHMGPPGGGQPMWVGRIQSSPALLTYMLIVDKGVGQVH